MQRTPLTLFVVLALLTACSPSPKETKEQSEVSPRPPVQQVLPTEALVEPEADAALAGSPAPSAETMKLETSRRSKSAENGLVAAEQAVPGYTTPTWNTESYNALVENGFINADRDPLSTFSIDVDTASYANIRRFIAGGSLPPAGAVRIEEMINYFTYQYPEPVGNDPFALSAEVGPSPFHADYRLVRLGLKAQDIARNMLPPSNLVFLIDVSGSMQDVNKLPLLKQAMTLLVDQLGARDRVAIVVYAGSDAVVLEPTAGNLRQEIVAAIDRLQSGGSTHASSGIRTAYQLARQGLMPGGNNRVILASDGDFNVGVTSRDELQRLIEQERQGGIYLTVLGFGMGNYHDDTMEILADKGNGNYAYIDSLLEAKKVMVKELSGTLFTLAGDVKIQVEFNPAKVGAYRLIGYENRVLADEDFRDDSKDAGEIGVGHRVTALYEVIPAGYPAVPQLDPLKYQMTERSRSSQSRELLTVKLRYKPLGQTNANQISLPVVDRADGQVSEDFQFAASVAGFGMLLTDSQHLGGFSWQQCLEMARAGRGIDGEGYRSEFSRLVEMSELLARQRQAAAPISQSTALKAARQPIR